MFNPTAMMIHALVQRLQTGYRQTYGNLKPEYAALMAQIATTTLEAIAHTDALYHDVEHTILVTLVGQEILLGKQLLERSVTPEDWLHLILALLCHDIGYIRGICQQDQPDQQIFTTGVGAGQVKIAPGATDAILTPYHVDRSKQFVAERFAAYQRIDIKVIQQTIELTRFPVPKDTLHQDTSRYPGLARAADLIGQLGDPRYLEKLPALFYEFVETGAHKALGYQHPGDLRLGYPKFFCTVVHPLIQSAIHYLEVTQTGRQILNGLYTNLSIVEQECVGGDNRACDRPIDALHMGDRYHFFLQDNSSTTQHLSGNSQGRPFPSLPRQTQKIGCP